MHVSAAPVRTALIAGTGNGAPDDRLHALVEAQFLAAEGMVLLERDQIGAALREHRLSATGLVRPGTALQLGQILGADILAVLEKLPMVADSPHNLRLLDSSTGLQLANEWVNPETAERNAVFIEALITKALAKRGTPSGARHVVSFVGVRNEALDPHLDGLARALSTLLPLDLGQSPGIWFLSREHLRYLRRERELVESQKALLASAVVLEIGLRPEGANGVAIGIMSGAPKGSAEKATLARLSLPTRDPTAVRKAIANEILARLQTPSGAALRSPGEEAAVFLRRALHYLAHGSFEEGLNLAEAAYALGPADETLFCLYQAAYHAPALQAMVNRMLTGDDYGPKAMLRMADALIYAKDLELRYWEDVGLPRTQRNLPALSIPTRKVWFRHPLRATGDWTEMLYPILRSREPGARLRLGELVAREETLLKRKLALCEGAADQASGCAHWWAALAEGICAVPAWAVGADEYFERLKALGDRASNPPEGFANPRLRDAFVLELAGRASAYGLSSDQTEKARAGYREWASGLPDPIFRLAVDVSELGPPHVMTLGDQIRILPPIGQPSSKPVKGRAVLQRFLAHPGFGRRREPGADDLARRVLINQVLLHVTEQKVKADAYRRLLVPVIETGDGVLTASWLISQPEWPILEDELGQARFRELMRGALQSIDQLLQRTEAQGGGSDPRPLHALRKRLLEHLPAAAAADSAASRLAWGRYDLDVRDLPMRPSGSAPAPDRNEWMAGMAMDGGKLISVFYDFGQSLLSVRSVDIGAATGKTIAQRRLRVDRLAIVNAHTLFPCTAIRNGQVAIALADGRLFVHTPSRQGLTEVRDLPAERISSLVWHEGELFLGMYETDRSGTNTVTGGALYRYRPLDGSFSCLASSRSVDRRNAFDGGGLWVVDRMAPGTHGRVWLASGGPAAADLEGHDGLWLLTPATGTFKRVVPMRADSFLVRQGALVTAFMANIVAHRSGGKAQPPLFLGRGIAKYMEMAAIGKDLLVIEAKPSPTPINTWALKLWDAQTQTLRYLSDPGRVKHCRYLVRRSDSEILVGSCWGHVWRVR